MTSPEERAAARRSMAERILAMKRTSKFEPRNSDLEKAPRRKRAPGAGRDLAAARAQARHYYATHTTERRRAMAEYYQANKETLNQKRRERRERQRQS